MTTMSALTMLINLINIVKDLNRNNKLWQASTSMSHLIPKHLFLRLQNLINTLNRTSPQAYVCRQYY